MSEIQHKYPVKNYNPKGMVLHKSFGLQGAILLHNYGIAFSKAVILFC